MQAFKLTGTSPDGKTATIWCCGNCKRVASSQEYAEKCCVCYYCGKLIEDNTDKCLSSPHSKDNIPSSYHFKCLAESQAKRHQEKVDKAEKIENWDGGVFWNDEYYESVEDAADSIYGYYFDDEEKPGYLWVAKLAGTHPLINFGRLIEDIEERLGLDSDGEGCYDYLVGTEEFKQACEDFNEKNKNLEWYVEDYTRMAKVIYPEE